MKAVLESTARALDIAKAFPEPPAALGGTSLTELLQSGKIEVKVDPKYPQAVGIANILKMTLTFGNSAWDILRNSYNYSPFFTSDFPVAIEYSDDPRVLNRIVPLTPSLAVRIRPDIRLDRKKCGFDFHHCRPRVYSVGAKELSALNRLLVQCAEELVFYRDDHPWVKPFISKYAAYRIEARTQEILGPNGKALLVSEQRIVERGSHPPL